MIGAGYRIQKPIEWILVSRFLIHARHVLGVVFYHQRLPLLLDVLDDGVCLGWVPLDLPGDGDTLRHLVQVLEVIHVDRDHDVLTLGLLLDDPLAGGRHLVGDDHGAGGEPVRDVPGAGLQLLLALLLLGAVPPRAAADAEVEHLAAEHAPPARLQREDHLERAPVDAAHVGAQAHELDQLAGAVSALQHGTEYYPTGCSLELQTKVREDFYPARPSQCNVMSHLLTVD